MSCTYKYRNTAWVEAMFNAFFGLELYGGKEGELSDLPSCYFTLPEGVRIGTG